MLYDYRVKRILLVTWGMEFDGGMHLLFGPRKRQDQVKRAKFQTSFFTTPHLSCPFSSQDSKYVIILCRKREQ